MIKTFNQRFITFNEPIIYFNLCDVKETNLEDIKDTDHTDFHVFYLLIITFYQASQIELYK